MTYQIQGEVLVINTKAIRIFRFGTLGWCALHGKYFQSGTYKFGDTELEALQALIEAIA